VPDLTRRRRRLVLAICCSSLFIVGLDNTIVNLALPAIRRDLGRRCRACSGSSTPTPSCLRAC